MRRYLKYFRPLFVLAFLKGLALKLRHGADFDVDLLRVFIHPSVEVSLWGGGKLRARGGGKRVYISRGSVLRASGGTLQLDEGVYLNQNCMVIAHSSIRLGRDTMLGPNVSIFDSDHRFDRTDAPFSEQGYVVAPVDIGENVWLGANVVVTRGCRIGRSVVVGANSIAKGRLEECSVYAGVPLRRVRAIGPRPAGTGE